MDHNIETVENLIGLDVLEPGDFGKLREIYRDSLDSSDPSGLFLAGYVAYHFADHGLGFESCEETLLKVIDLAPNHGGAQWYLACHYFDTGSYSDSLSWLDRFCGLYLMDIPVWQRLKAIELGLVIRLRLGLGVSPAELAQWSSEYFRAEAEDRPVPLEMRNVVLESGEVLDGRIVAEIRWTCDDDAWFGDRSDRP